MSRLDIADLDVIFLTFDEPQKEEFWVKIKNQIPWAQRIDGVKGSDSAHKAAALCSGTERFILIDGDNLPDWNFFNSQLVFPDSQWESAVYRWRARNHVNGLMYGNGGLSSWTREFVLNMKTHENTDGKSETQVEFCFDPLYWPMHDCFSTTFPNGSAQQAWRAGFREGVKMCLNRGQKPTVQEFQSQIEKRNLDHLTIWHNVGADVENGVWAMAGARLGTHKTMLTDWEYQQVQSFDILNQLWQEIKDQNPWDLIIGPEQDLKNQLNLPMNVLTADQSRFFKHHYRSNWVNQGIMVREIDVIRKQEKW
jgi:hypothetical protein